MTECSNVRRFVNPHTVGVIMTHTIVPVGKVYGGLLIHTKLFRCAPLEEKPCTQIKCNVKVPEVNLWRL